jgi:hypothetical protein
VNENVRWEGLSKNPNAIPILEQNIDKINWIELSLNPNAIHLLEKNLDKVYWSLLSRNPNAIHLLEKNIDKIDWCRILSNPNAIHLIEQHMDKVIYYYGYMFNPNAIHLLAPLDHEKMKKNMSLFKEELVEYVFNPQRLMRLSIHIGISFDDLNELY